MNAAIYCRVSTDNQENVGTSLQTQLEACLKHCHDRSYRVAYRFREDFTGLLLERPEMDRLRELVRSRQIDTVVIYCLDRYVRDPTHGAILQDELEKYGVRLESVTEDIDNSDLGKLISYIRSFAAKLEAEKIRERTMRGKKAKAKEGRVPCGGYSRLYGYNYMKVREINGGRRLAKEDEAKWVRQMFVWLVESGMSCLAIATKLNSMHVSPKYGAYWSRGVVHGILSNPAYTGVTIYRQVESIELPEVTPPIIEKTLFEAAQKQLKVNYENAKRNVKRDYLLHGHVYCSLCKRRYWTRIVVQHRQHNTYRYRRYVCSATSGTAHSPVMGQCHNKGWSADKLESAVWNQIRSILGDPELIVHILEQQRQGGAVLEGFKADLRQVGRQLKEVDKNQAQLLQWALKGFPEDQVVSENKKLNAARESLRRQQSELDAKIEASENAIINLPKIRDFVESIREKLYAPDFEIKRTALVLSCISQRI